MSVQFHINSKKNFILCFSPSTVFTFIAKEAWICISIALWIFKTKPWDKLFDDIWRHGCRSVDECPISNKEQEFFRFVLQSIYCLHFYCKRRLSLYFRPRYESLKLNHDTNYLMTSEDTVEGRLVSFQFYKISKSFFISRYSPSTVFFIAKDAWTCISTTLWIFKTKPWHKSFDDIWRHGCRSVDECPILYKEQEFYRYVFQSIYCLHFYCKRRLSLFLDHAMNL